MKTVLFASVSLFILVATSAAADQQQFPAKLAGQAILPANTMVPAPADAPEFLKHSGKFTTADRKRTEALGTVPGKDGARITDLKLPFNGQPIQGFSGIKTMTDGTFWTLSDNGFGCLGSAQALSLAPAPLSRSMTRAVVSSSMLKSPIDTPLSSNG